MARFCLDVDVVFVFERDVFLVDVFSDDDGFSVGDDGFRGSDGSEGAEAGSWV